MCLTIPQNPALVAPKTRRSVYKVYYTSIKNGEFKVTGYHRPIEFSPTKDSILVSSRPSKVVTDRELKSREIFKGLHAYTSFEKAKRHMYRGSIVLRLSGAPMDFVAKGRNKDVVYTQLRIEEIMAVKPGNRKTWNGIPLSYSRVAMEKHFKKPKQTIKLG